MTKFNDLTVEAAKYRELALKIKELEQQAMPLKKQLLKYAETINQPLLSIGELTIEKRITEKVTFDENKFTPKLFSRWLKAGGACFLKIGIDRKCYGNTELGEMIEEIGGVISKSSTFAIRV